MSSYSLIESDMTLTQTAPAGAFAIQGVTVNMPDAESLLGAMRAKFAKGEGFAVATLNLDHVAKLAGTPAFRAAYARHDLVTADGFPIVWACRLAGGRSTRVAGSDMVEPMIAMAAELGLRVAFVGSTQQTLEDAAQVLEARFPKLVIAAKLAPSRNFDPNGQEADDILEALEAENAQLIFVCLGAPKQEIFAARGRERLTKAAFASVGGGIDFIVGAQRRAPALFQRLNMEWTWRLLTNPKRLAGRYARAATMLPQLLTSALRYRQSRAAN